MRCWRSGSWIRIAARAELPAVEHEVVGLRPHRHRIGLEPVEVVGVGHGERVVGRLRTAVVVDALEQREVDDPQVAVRTLVDRRTAEVVAQRAEDLARHRPLVGNDQQQVAGLGASASHAARLLGLAQELGDRRVETVGGDPHPHQALGPQRLARSVRPSSLLRP